MKKILALFMSIVTLLTVITSVNTVADAKKPIFQKTLDYYKIDGKGYDYELTLETSKVVYIEVDLSIDKYYIGRNYSKKLDGKNGVRLTIEQYDEETNEYETIDTFKWCISKNQTEGYYWYCSDDKLKGDCNINITSVKDNIASEAMECKIRVFTYSNYAKKAKLPKSKTVEAGYGEWVNISKLSPNGSIGYATWETNNKEIAKISSYWLDDVYIKGVKTGKCTLTATLNNGKKYKCIITVKKPTPKLNKTDIEIPFASKKKLKVKHTKKKIKWSSSNIKIATVNSKGVVTAKGIGKCEIYAKFGKKKLTCKVEVYRKWPDFVALLTDYDTRDNYFTVKYKNYGSSTVTILSKDAYCMDVDYKSYDRKLYLKGNKSIKIKPGKSKTVKFKVKGSGTWYDYTDFTIRYYFKYNGGKYLGSVWDEESVFKRGKHWYATYWYDTDMEKFYGNI